MSDLILVIKDDDKPMIEVLDQLSAAALESLVHVTVSDSVSSALGHYFQSLEHKGGEHNKSQADIDGLQNL